MNNKKISKRRERGIAKATSGASHINSGALWWQKSDASDPAFQYEDKFTYKPYYSVSLRVLHKIEKEALAVGKLPVLVIGFLDEGRHLSYDFAALRKKDCVVEGASFEYITTAKKSQRLHVSYLQSLYYKYDGILLHLCLNEESYYIFSWKYFLSRRADIIEGVRIQ